MALSDELQEAINSATLSRLQKTLLSICEKSEEASKLAGDELLIQESASNKRKSDDKDSALRYEWCIQCSSEYDTTNNGPESCQWHSGDLDVDDEGDFWADHDENCYGEIDKEEMREEYPDGFVWSCCNVLGGGGAELDETDLRTGNKYRNQPVKYGEAAKEILNGCKKGFHRSKKDEKKKSVR